jgi:hypothetical protein
MLAPGRGDFLIQGAIIADSVCTARGILVCEVGA